MSEESYGPPVLVGIPYDAGSSYLRGAAAAPTAVRAALRSASANLWSELFVDIGLAGRLDDAGDLPLTMAMSAAATREAIKAGIHEVVKSGGRPISLGGDHSITYPIIRGFGESARAITILQIDAHGDLYSHFEGDRYSHACPFARIMESGLVKRLVQVGVRALSEEQRVNAERFGVETIDMRAWVSGVRPQLAGPVYLSLDIDGIDPAHAPGVSHREPGGLTVREVITMIQALPAPIVGADIVEFNPGEDILGMTAPVCAKLVKEIASRMFETS